MQVKKTVEIIRTFPELGLRIKQSRINDKRSLTAICKECDISRSYWYALENEKLTGAVSLDILKKIETVLNINLMIDFD